MLAIVDGNGDGILQINEFFMRGDIVVLATPEIAGLPYVISGLVAAGGMAAAMSTADGLLLAIANALSHDLYYKMIDPKADDAAPADRRARAAASSSARRARSWRACKLTGILGAVAWAFCFAMSGLFFPLVLGVWWKRANRPGAIAGMVDRPRRGQLVPVHGVRGRHEALARASITCASASSARPRAWSRWSW